MTFEGEGVANPLTAFDLAGVATDFVSWSDDLAFETLKISFLLIMFEELADGISQGVLAEEDYSFDGFAPWQCA